MHVLKKILLLFGLLVFLVMGAFLLLIASNLHGAADVGQPTPQPMTLVELSEHGPGHNAHVEVTDFTFGQPIIEQDGEHWRCVWLPLKPSSKGTRGVRPVMLRLGDAPDQERLDQLLTQKHVTALVASAHPRSIWNIPPAETFQAAHPELASDKVLFLMYNPNLEIGGITFLTEAGIFDRTNARNTQIVGWSLIGLVVIAAVLLVRSLRFRPVSGSRPPPPPNEDDLRTRLLGETPLSIHTFRFWGALGHSFVFGFCAVLFLGFCLFALGMTASFIERAQPIHAVAAGLMALGMFVAVFLFLNMGFKVFTCGALRIAVFPSGLRWRTLFANRSALWSDIARIDRIANLHYGTRMDTLELDLYSGETLFFALRALSDYDTFTGNLSAYRNVPGGPIGLAQPGVASGRNIGRRRPEDWEWK